MHGRENIKANLDFKEYEQAILTHIMLHHHQIHQHYVSRHVGHFDSILHSKLLYQDVFVRPGCCAMWGCSPLPTLLDYISVPFQGSSGTHFEQWTVVQEVISLLRA